LHFGRDVGDSLRGADVACVGFGLRCPVRKQKNKREGESMAGTLGEKLAEAGFKQFEIRPTSQFVIVTPEYATKLLEANFKNRNLRAKTVGQFNR
jgi:hypothetical protein